MCHHLPSQPVAGYVLAFVGVVASASHKNTLHSQTFLSDGSNQIPGSLHEWQLVQSTLGRWMPWQRLGIGVVVYPTWRSWNFMVGFITVEEGRRIVGEQQAKEAQKKGATKAE